MTGKQSGFVSVVLPLHNDAAVLGTFLDALFERLEAHYEDYEVVVVDNGSTDATSEVLARHLKRFEGLRVLRLSRYFGLETAVNAGFESVVGDVVVVMLPASDPVDLITVMVDRVRACGAVVLGRKPEADYSLMERSLRRLFHSACRHLAGIDPPERTTAFVGVTRPALNSINAVRDRFRYLKTFGALVGKQIEFLDYREAARRRRPFSEALGLALEIMVGNSMRPLRLVSLLCLALSGFYLLYTTYVVAVFLFKERVAEGWVTLSMQSALAFFVLSIVLLVLGEYLGRVLMESRERPQFFVAEEKTSSVLIPRQGERLNVVNDTKPAEVRRGA